MGRELRRKEEKKNKIKKNIKNHENLDTSIKGITILKVFGGIVLILLVVYYAVAVFITKEIDFSNKSNSSTSDSSSTSSVSNRILASNIFNQKEEIYYVYCYNFNDEDNVVGDAVNSSSDKKIYRLDTGSSLNSKYVVDDSGNRSATGLDDLKISDPTLLAISGDSIVGYYEGKNEIIQFLSE